MADRNARDFTADIDASDHDPEYHKVLTEYIDRLNAGEDIDPMEIITVYPDRCQEILGDLRFFTDAADEDLMVAFPGRRRRCAGTRVASLPH